MRISALRFVYVFQERPQWADFTILTLWEKNNKLNVAAGSSFYTNCCFNIKHVEIKCNTRKVAGSRPARNIVNTFCSHFLSSFYKRLLCRNAWLIFSYALFKHRIFLSRLTNIINVIVYFVFSFSYLKKFYAFETSRLSGLRGCLYFLLDNMVVTAQSTRQGYVVHAQMFDRCVCCSTLVWVQHNFEPKSVNLSADRPLSNNQNGYFFCCTIIGVSITYL